MHSVAVWSTAEFRAEQTHRRRPRSFLFAATLFCTVAAIAGGQTPGAVPPAEAPGHVVLAEASTVALSPSARVTLNAQDASMSQVLSAFSLQTGRSVVIGPEVTGNVNLRLNDVPWEQALDVILKPYGYGYRQVGDTIVVNALSKMQEVETVEPLESRVFALRFLDAADVRDIVHTQLSPRGQVTVLTMRGQRGWEFATGESGRSSQHGSEADKRARAQDANEQIKSKTIIVTDVPSVLQRVAQIIDQVDQRPAQVLIEARFVEVDENALRDMGFDFGTGASGATAPGVQPVTVTKGGNIVGLGAQSQAGAVSPSAFAAKSAGVAETAPYNTGLSLLFQQLTGKQFEILLHMLAEKAKANILSSPRILTLNNQEATIVVGTKFPIIKSDTSGINATTSTSLEYYENIGIQLNVVPQVCDGGYVSMIVHPAVTDQIGTTAARTQTDQNIPLTEYPVLSTREAETQILLKSGQTVVIGGLLEERDRNTVLKVPLLGDIPLLGHLFKRTTKSGETFDLLIFLTATIIPDPALAGIDARPPTTGPEVGESFVTPSEAARYASKKSADEAALAKKTAEEKAAARKQARLDAEKRRAAAERAAAAEAAARDAQARKLAAKQAAAERAAAQKADAERVAAEQRAAKAAAEREAAMQAAPAAPVATEVESAPAASSEDTVAPEPVAASGEVQPAEVTAPAAPAATQESSSAFYTPRPVIAPVSEIRMR